MNRLRHVFTLLAGVCFIVALFYTHFFSDLEGVSRETFFRKNFTHATEGVSVDGTFVLRRVPVAPIVPPRLKVMNHGRTMRVFFSQDGPQLALYVETLKPLLVFRIEGAFLVNQGDQLFWMNEHTIGVTTTASSKTDSPLLIDLLNRTSVNLDVRDGDNPNTKEQFLDIIIP